MRARTGLAANLAAEAAALDGRADVRAVFVVEAARLVNAALQRSRMATVIMAFVILPLALGLDGAHDAQSDNASRDARAEGRAASVRRYRRCADRDKRRRQGKDGAPFDPGSHLPLHERGPGPGLCRGPPLWITAQALRSGSARLANFQNLRTPRLMSAKFRRRGPTRKEPACNPLVPAHNDRLCGLPAQWRAFLRADMVYRDDGTIRNRFNLLVRRGKRAGTGWRS